MKSPWRIMSHPGDRVTGFRAKHGMTVAKKHLFSKWVEYIYLSKKKPVYLSQVLVKLTKLNIDDYLET